MRDWASRKGHEIAFLVTPRGGTWASPVELVSLASPGTVVMAVPNVEACGPTLSATDVDLGIVFAFPPIPEDVAMIPRNGMVNLHPSLLPAYRGANGFRSLYDGSPRIGATLHHLTPELDTGPILAQASEPTPEDIQPTTALEALQRTAAAVLESGVPRALAGEPGEEQGPSPTPPADRFTEAETLLDLGLAAHNFQCRFSALSLAGLQPRVALDGQSQPLRAARLLPGLSAQGPGVIRQSSRRAIVAAADAVLELELGELPF